VSVHEYRRVRDHPIACNRCVVSPRPRDRDLEKDLAEQLQFLASSASAFDQGELSESKRIALVIRLLVHDTTNSHSLLAQLDIKHRLAWADSAPVIDHDPNIVARSPGLTNMGMGAGGITFGARYSDQIERSDTTRYVTFDDWWERPVILDSNDAEFSRRDLVLALTNKDGGAHIDRLNEKTHALVHSNSAGFVRVGAPGAAQEPIPTPIYASVRTVAEELLLTLRRSGRQVPSSGINLRSGSIDMFVAADYRGNPLVLDKSRDDVSRVHFTFDTLPGVTFEVTRLQLAQSDAAFDGTFPAGWLDIVGVLDATGAVVHQSGIAGPTDASTPQNAAARPSEPKASHEPVEFTFDNFSQATFVAIRSNEKQETVTPWGREVREAGWVDLFVTLNDGTWQIGGFAAPTAP
jgi:hypothetical protein